MTKVLGIIVAYKHKDVVEKCLQYASKQTADVDWVVWNNGGIHNISINIRYNMKVHNSQTNMLWTPALNEAIKLYLKPEHTHILYMNHDIFLPYDTISVLINKLEETGGGAIGPVGSSLGGLQDHVSHLNTFKHTNIVRATYLMGAIQLMKREVWDMVGPFDNDMPLGGDDFDYSIRMKEAGYSLWVTSKIYVNHVGHVTGQSAEWEDYGGKSWARFNEKYDMYYANEAEAIGSLWGSIYNEEYPLGTGISEEEKVKRGIKNA